MADDFLKSTVDKVADVIDEAISSNDYTDLSREIGSLMRDVVDSVGDAAKSALEFGDTRSQGQKSAEEASRRVAARKAAKKKEAEERAAKEREETKYFAKPEEDMGGSLMQTFGTIGAVLFGLATMILGVFSTFSFEAVRGLTVPLAVIAGILTACSIAMAVLGRRRNVKTKRFKSYRNLIMPKLYADVGTLSKQMNLPESTVVSDLEGYTREGKIRQGHFDDKKQTFIASDELYEQYRATMEMAEMQKRNSSKAQARDASLSPEVREILQKGNEYIDMIHRANDEIPDEEITEKLNRMEMIVRRIFEEVREEPANASKLNMFMNYYLPTTTKLVEAYREMDSQPLQGESIRKAKKEIADSLDTINDAFEKLHDSFFTAQAMDVKSDLNVMKMMMKQEGLTADDLTAMKKKQAAAASAPAPQSAAAQAAGAKTAAGTRTAADVRTAAGTQAAAGAQAVSASAAQGSAFAASAGAMAQQMQAAEERQ